MSNNNIEMNRIKGSKKFILSSKGGIHCSTVFSRSLSKTGFPAFQENKIPSPWLFPDFSLMKSQNSMIIIMGIWHPIFKFLPQLCHAHIAPATLITCFCAHTWCTNRPIKIPWLFPDLRHFSQIPWLFPDWKKVKWFSLISLMGWEPCKMQFKFWLLSVLSHFHLRT